ncbi:hypothetical protein [Actinomadura logoneensis]|uniref:hypothetical protein n=1 Tax=Actinomadura logoneensis TaxID=2293572 RepID=UPI001314CA0C|nr:hypothetical protein [Actinomadura logoneensis]
MSTGSASMGQGQAAGLARRVPQRGHGSTVTASASAWRWSEPCAASGPGRPVV